MFKELVIDAISLLSELIEIQSFSKDETNRANFLESYLETKGYVVNRCSNNIWLMTPGFSPEKPTILLNSHLDTVKPVSGWTKNPFKPTVEGDKLFGLGSNDAGASVVSLLSAFIFLTKSTQNFNLIFAATAEEEISGVNGVESLIKELPIIDFAIVGEPTAMQLAVAEKGLMVLDITISGKAGHAARSEGVNAIYEALPVIEWFKNHKFDKVSELLGPVKTTVTQINSGTQHNVVPDLCSLVVDIRSNELYSNEEILSEVKRNLACIIQPRSVRLGSTATPLDHPIVKKGMEIGLKLYGSPTLSDQALMKFPSVKLGPGDSSRSHTADEYVLLSEIEGAVNTYIKLLNDLKL